MEDVSLCILLVAEAGTNAWIVGRRRSSDAITDELE